MSLDISGCLGLSCDASVDPHIKDITQALILQSYQEADSPEKAERKQVHVQEKEDSKLERAIEEYFEEDEEEEQETKSQGELKLELMDYEARLHAIEAQLLHHKMLSMQLQSISLETAFAATKKTTESGGGVKQRYTYTEETKKKKEAVRDTREDAKFRMELIKGVGLSDASPDGIPKQLLRAYKTYRYDLDHPPKAKKAKKAKTAETAEKQ